MPFASINPTNPRTNRWNFRKKILRIGDFENLSFFQLAISNFSFSQKKCCFIPIKISPNLYGRMDELKFWCFHWFPENSLLCVILRYTVYNKVNKVEMNKGLILDNQNEVNFLQIGVWTLKDCPINNLFYFF